MNNLNRLKNIFRFREFSTETTHFGFQQVPKDEKVHHVGRVFSSVSKSYDLMNDLMSFGIHRIWKDHLIEKLCPTADMHLLDVAGGTGDVAKRFLIKTKDFGPGSTARVTVGDINPDMLAEGKRRWMEQLESTDKMSFELLDAQKLLFEDNSFDAYTISFGIRNCTDVDSVLREAYRVLKPGGRFLCLEFGKVHECVRKPYDSFSFNLIPLMGEFVANDRKSYQYLVESIRKFPPQPEFAEMIKNAGFKAVEWEDLTFGVAAIHSGWKL
jgi:2-methoxy-6-polyprenyl-1,4-benzoquinol methylase